MSEGQTEGQCGKGRREAGYGAEPLRAPVASGRGRGQGFRFPSRCMGIDCTAEVRRVKALVGFQRWSTDAGAHITGGQ